MLWNSALKRVPFSLKYAIGRRLRVNRAPYCLIKPGSIVVQIGAARDTLEAGRSRGIYFSLFAGYNGRVIVVEPEKKMSVTLLRL